MIGKEVAMFEYSKPSRSGPQPQKRPKDGDQRAEKAARRVRKAQVARARERDMMDD